MLLPLVERGELADRELAMSDAVVLARHHTTCPHLIDASGSQSGGRVQVVGAVGWGHARLPLPDGVHPVMRALVARCFAEPAERPSFSEVLDILKPLQTPLAAAAAAAAALAAHPDPGMPRNPNLAASAAASSASSSPAARLAAGAQENPSPVGSALPCAAALNGTKELGGPANMRVMLEGAQSATPVLQGSEGSAVEQGVHAPNQAAPRRAPRRQMPSAVVPKW